MGIEQNVEMEMSSWVVTATFSFLGGGNINCWDNVLVEASVS